MTSSEMSKFACTFCTSSCSSRISISLSICSAFFSSSLIEFCGINVTSANAVSIFASASAFFTFSKSCESVITSPADSDFRIDEDHPRSGIAVLALQGDADLHSANELHARLGAAIEDGAAMLVVDLSRVTFIDSMALGVLLEAMKRLRARGGVLRIVGPRPDVRRIFEITLLDRIFPLDATRSEALAAGAENGSA